MNTQTCPRRMSDWGPWERAEGLDRWDAAGHGLSGQADVGRSCSFCGSLEPGRFLELVREGWSVGPTDKNYKVYLSKPRTADEMDAEKARWLATDRVTQAMRSAGEAAGRTAEQIDAELEQHWATQMEPMLADGSQVAKFYLQHLSQQQRTEFLELHNQGHMRLSYPGRFYVPPFFAHPAPAA